MLNITPQVLSIAKAGSTALNGAVTLTGGANITLTQSGQDISIAGLAGTVTSVSGTTDRITSTGGATPVIDIASTYVGQTSITTLGTITTGIWNAGAVTSSSTIASTTTITAGTGLTVTTGGITVTAGASTLKATTITPASGSVGLTVNGLGTTALVVAGVAGQYAVSVTHVATAGQSYGVLYSAGTNSSDLNMYLRSADGATPFLYVRGDGNIGVGNVSPTVKLDVTGAIKASTTLTAGTGLTVTAGTSALQALTATTATFTGAVNIGPVAGYGLIVNTTDSATARMYNSEAAAIGVSSIIYFASNNASAAIANYAYFGSYTDVITAGAQTGSLILGVYSAGSAVERIRISTTGVAVTGALSATTLLTASGVGTHIFGPNASTAGSTATTMVISGQNSANVGFSLRQGATERAAFTAASDGNTYIDYQGNLNWRESAAYATRIIMASTGATQINNSAGTGLTIGSGLTVTAGVVTISATTGNSLVVDTNAFVVDATNDRVGIRTASPATVLHIQTGDIADSALVRIETTGSRVAGVELLSGHGNWGVYNSDTVGDALEFRDDSAGATRMIINSVGNVGIGTTSVSGKVQVKAATNENFSIAGHNTIATGVVLQAFNDANDANVPIEYRASIHDFTIGNVGIGNSSPTGLLDVLSGRSRFTPSSETYAVGVRYSSAAGAAALYWIGATNSATPDMVFSNSAGTENVRFTNGGSVGVGVNPTSAKLQVNGSTQFGDGSVGYISVDGSGHRLGFSRANVSHINATDAAGALGLGTGGVDQRVHISSGGYVGIGLTTNTTYLLQVNTDSAAKPGVGGLWTVISDSRLKENITLADLDRCYEIVQSVPLKHYTWKDNAYTEEQVKDRSAIGWIAEDVKEVFPKSVQEAPFKQVDGEVIEDALDLNGGEMLMAMYGAVQKLMQKVEILESKMV